MIRRKKQAREEKYNRRRDMRLMRWQHGHDEQEGPRLDGVHGSGGPRCMSAYNRVPHWWGDDSKMASSKTAAAWCLRSKQEAS